jgi:arylsulfatase A-like enzyme
VQEHRLAAACYYALITEIDQQFGRLLEMLETTGQVDNTIVVLTTDHGDALGAHGLYMKNIGAFEETYNIPLVLAGPGVAQGRTCGARVGLHDLCPTLVELAGGEPIDTVGESQSFADVLRDPDGAAAGHRRTGYAEYFGTRYLFTQRVIWDSTWKLVWNGFDFDELYNLKDDPHEMHNLAEDPAHADRMRQMLALAWDYARRTNDHTLVNTHYPVLRLEPYGPEIAARD